MAHLGTYKVGEITYDAHTGQAIAGTDSVNTEFVDEYNSTYQEVNLTPYSQLQDNDNAFGDQQASLFTNGNGDAALTFDGANEGTATTFPPLYDFEKGEFTNLGKGFYTKQMANSSQEEKDAYLTQVENELKSALIADYNKRKLSNPNAKPNPLLNLNSMGEIEGAGDQEASFQIPEFGKVDKILQQLSLRNLKYPIDADYGNTQDYIQINQFSYRPPNDLTYFPRPQGTPGTKDYRSSRRVGFDNALRTAGLGVRTGTPKEKAIGLVKLPMPNSLADSNNVSWGPDQLNALTAAATSAVMGTSNSALDGVLKFLAEAEGKDFGELLSSGIGGVGGFLKGTATDLGDAIKGVGGVGAAMNSSNINLLGKTVLGSTLLNLIGFQVSPESILARGAGVIPNDNLALLFNAPTLREFTFSWKMSPRSREEATRVNNILRFFKQGMAAKKSNNSTGGGGASYFLGTPNVFDIHFKTAKTQDYEILDRNDSVLRIKTCACTGAAVNYTPEGMWNAYEKGQPTAITLTLRFNELEPIFDTDYDNNYFNFDPQRTDLLPVPTDAVGY